MPLLMYRDNDSGIRPSFFPYILGRALNQYRINTSVTIYIFNQLLYIFFKYLGDNKHDSWLGFLFYYKGAFII